MSDRDLQDGCIDPKIKQRSCIAPGVNEKNGIGLSVAVGSRISVFDQPMATISTKLSIGSRFDWIHFAPHCHGTHIEGPAHINRLGEGTLSLVQRLPVWHRACLIREFEHPPAGVNAFLIKTGWQSGADWWPVLSPAWLSTLPSNCLLLVDAPSVDPQWDEGKLIRHGVWFGKGGMIVELCQFPSTIEYGREYWLLLNVAAFISDAIPCRPVLYPA